MDHPLCLMVYSNEIVHRMDQVKKVARPRLTYNRERVAVQRLTPQLQHICDVYCHPMYAFIIVATTRSKCKSSNTTELEVNPFFHWVLRNELPDGIKSTNENKLNQRLKQQFLINSYYPIKNTIQQYNQQLSCTERNAFLVLLQPILPQALFHFQTISKLTRVIFV